MKKTNKPQDTIRLTIAFVSLVALYVFIDAGYRYWGWTGFGTVSHVKDGATVYSPYKTLWDWLDLLIVPLVLAVGAFLFNRAEAKTGRDLNKHQMRENALETYLDRMTDLMIESDIVNSDPASIIRIVARTRTLTVLRRLDGTRKGVVVQFLYESGLLGKTESNRETILDLAGADLSHIDLRDVDLSGANLCRCNLEGANLRGAILRQTDLRESNLGGAQLQEAEMFLTRMEGSDLHDANLHKVHMERVRLNSANLTNAYIVDAKIWVSHLENANLKGAQVQHSDLSGTKLAVSHLEGANLWDTGNIDRDELRSARIDDKTRLPEYLHKEFGRE